MSKRKIVVFVFVCIALFAGAVISLAAPILIEGELSDPVRSLAGLKQVRLKIQLQSPNIVEAGLDSQTIDKEWRLKLQTAGFEVMEKGDDLPLLELTVKAVSDPKVNDGLGVSAVLILYQRVHVERLEADLMLPTYVHTPGGVVPPLQLKAQVQEAIDFALNVFLQNCHRATARGE